MQEEIRAQQDRDSWTVTDELLLKLIVELRDLRIDTRALAGDKHPPARFQFRRPIDPAPQRVGMAAFARAHTKGGDL